MRALLQFYGGLTRFFGARRRFVRRVAGLALIVLGVHAAADLIDDAVFRVIDGVDLAVDSAAWSLLEWLSSIGAFAAEAAARHAQTFAEWLDLGEKDWLAKVIALLLELVVDAVLLDFAWGKRSLAFDNDQRVGLVEELRESARELGSALWPLDLERLTVPLILFALSTAGALSTSVALEGFFAGLLADLLPLWRWGTNVGASLGLLSAILVVWRFVPDLVHGGILRAQERGEAALARLDEARHVAHGRSRLAMARAHWRRVRRGAFLALVVLPVAYLSLSAQAAFFALIARTGANL